MPPGILHLLDRLDDAGIAKLVRRLSSRSRWFAGLWEEHHVEVRRSTTKRVHHPVAGMLEMDIDTLHIPDRDQRLVIYTAAPGTASHEALQLLKVVGTQALPA